MGKTKYAVELAQYLREEGGKDGTMIGISDAKLCASALKLYARVRRGAFCLLVAAVPAGVVPLMGFGSLEFPSFTIAAKYSVAEQSFELRPATPCIGFGTAAVKPM